MAENIIMPQLGESIAEGTIVKWLKNIGDLVQKDENVLLISTDKVEAEIPSPKTGVLISISAKEGQTVPVGTVLGQVGEKEENVIIEPKKEIKEVKEIKIEKIQEKTEEKTSDLKSFLSPLVKNIAKEHQIEKEEVLSIEGTGRFGRVSKNDLLSYIENKPQIEEKPAKSIQTIVPGERKPISTMRKVIMENMVASRRTSAHVTTFFEIDYTNIDKIRATHKERFLKEEGISLTYTTFIASAVCEVLKRHPFINASIEKDSIVFRKEIHLGMAVAIFEPEPGLMVPVIKNADKINLRGLAHAVHDLSFRVRNKKIKPDELSGGSFTITNPGNYGAIIGTPIINQPQVAILGVGQIKKEPKVVEIDGQDMIAIRNVGWLSLSFDHRLIDGATADIFMKDLKTTLENFKVNF